MTNHPKIAADARLNTNDRIFFSLIDWNMPTTEKIAIKPKITINKFIKKDTPLCRLKNECNKQYSTFIVKHLQYLVEEK